MAILVPLLHHNTTKNDNFKYFNSQTLMGSSSSVQMVLRKNTINGLLMRTHIFVLIGTENQRTNCPVNAHLISWPTISFAKFNIVVKYVKVNSGHIYINFVELEYIILHAKFHDHRTISSVGEDF